LEPQSGAMMINPFANLWLFLGHFARISKGGSKNGCDMVFFGPFHRTSIDYSRMVMPSRGATFCHTLYHIVTCPVCKQKLRPKLRYIAFSAGSTVVCEMVCFGPFQIQITWEIYSIETDLVLERVNAFEPRYCNIYRN
jgi:hypothetical protein